MEDEESHNHLFSKRDYFKVDYADLKKQLEVIGKAIEEEDQTIQEELKPTLDELLDKIHINQCVLICSFTDFSLIDTSVWV